MNLNEAPTKEETGRFCQTAEKDLPSLRQFAEKLLALSKKLLKNVQYSEEDHFAFMVLCFLSKQIDHMESILILRERRDVELIARSMLEGMCQLLWAARAPNSCAKQWRSFALVHDWRVLQARITAGESVEATKRADIEQRIHQYEGLFLTHKARLARDRGGKLPDDPYYINWTGHDAKYIFDSVGEEISYQNLYRYFSEWIHWSPAGFGRVITRQQSHVGYSSGSPAASAAALATGFKCLWQTAKSFDEHLKLGMTPKLKELLDEYLAWGKVRHNNGA